MPLIARIAIVFMAGAVTGTWLHLPPIVCLLSLSLLIVSKRESTVLFCIALLGLGLATLRDPSPISSPHLPKIQSRIDTLFPNEYPLVESLLISERKNLDPQIKADFATAGLSHMLAISGAHVALIAGMIMTLASLFRPSRRTVDIIGFAGATWYVMLLGAPFAASRSLIQMGMLMLSRSRQQPAHPVGMLAFAAIVITAIAPAAPLDIGFQLSFAGILGLILWRRPLIELLPKIIPHVVRDALGTTLAAVATTTPIAAYHFGTVSVIAPLANLVAAPVMAIALPATVFVVALSTISMQAAHALAPGTELSLALFEKIAHVSANLPYSHFAISRSQTILTTLSGALAFYLLKGSYKSTLRGRAVIASMAGCVPLIALTPDRGAVELHMIDVGQGDAIAIRSPRGRWLLVDAGPPKGNVTRYLLKHNVNHIEAMLISHPHLDHYGGARKVIDDIGVGAVIDPIMPVPSPAFDSVLVTASSHHLRYLEARTGKTMSIDGMRLEFLAPDNVSADGPDAANDYSETFLLTYGRFSALFTGDTSCKGEEAMLAHAARLDVQVLKVGHHGSGTSSCAPFLEAVTPKIALISDGRHNRYGHPSPRTLYRLTSIGARIFRTDQSGSIKVVGRLNGEIEVSTSQ